MRALFLATIVLVAGTAGLLAACWALDRLARRINGDDALVIRPPVPRYPKQPEADVEATREAARRREALAASHRRSSDQICSGAVLDGKLRAVK